jgi:nucleotide-binding universal stress UspA family protein
MRLENIDLLVLGTHGRGGVKKLVLGSMAEEVLHLAPCPVLTVGPSVPTPTSGAANPRIILFATDFGAPSVKAFPYALSLAEDFRAKLILLHVVPPKPALEVGPGLYTEDQLARWENAARQESTRKLRELLPLESQMAQEAEYMVGIAFISEGILGAAAARQAELIVMGVRRTRLARAAAIYHGLSSTTWSARRGVRYSPSGLNLWAPERCTSLTSHLVLRGPCLPDGQACVKVAVWLPLLCRATTALTSASDRGTIIERAWTGHFFTVVSRSALNSKHSNGGCTS